MPFRFVIVRTGPRSLKANLLLVLTLTLLVPVAIATLVFLFSFVSFAAVLALGVFIVVGLLTLVSRLMFRVGTGKGNEESDGSRGIRDRLVRRGDRTP